MPIYLSRMNGSRVYYTIMHAILIWLAGYVGTYVAILMFPWIRYKCVEDRRAGRNFAYVTTYIGLLKRVTGKMIG